MIYISYSLSHFHWISVLSLLQNRPRISYIQTFVKTVHTFAKTIHTLAKTIHTLAKTIRTFAKTIHTLVLNPPSTPQLHTMKSFSISLGVALLSALPQLTHAWYECSLSNAVPLSSLQPQGGSGSTSGGSTGGYNPASDLDTEGCDAILAAGGTCPTKAKRHNHDFVGVLQKRTTYTTLPCLDSMHCVTVSNRLGCFDLNSLAYIDDQGTCGNTGTGQYEEGCVDEFLKEQSTSVSATGVKATATATGTVKATATGASSGASSTATSLGAKGGVANKGGDRVARGSSLGLFMLVAGLFVV
jgi:hypothetical protein